MSGFDVRDTNAGADNKKKKTGKFVIVARVLLVLEIAALVALAFYLYKLLPIRYFGLGFGLAALVAAIQIVMLIGRQKGNGKALFSFVLSVVFLAIEIFGLVFLFRTYSALDQMSTTKNVTVTTTMNVYVRAEDPYEEISELKGHVFGALEIMDAQNTALAITKIGEEIGEEIEVSKFVGISPLAEALKGGDVDAFMINSGYVDLLTDVDETFEEWARLLCSFEVERTVSDVASVGTSSEDGDIEVPELPDVETEDIESAAPVENVSMDSFIIYISGLDNRGSQIVSNIGNSDANILMVVNPNTYKILLVNTPRDYYYYLYGNTSYPDKLTHTGCYGIDCSVTTLNSLYGISINYYVKVGFNSVVNIVNALGGITVYSEYAFSQDGYSFSVGDNYLDGAAALAFSRNRKSLPGGDRQRGKNQQAVITAIINKLTSAAVIANYGTILDSITSNTVTSLSSDDISRIIQLQLDKMPTWDITSISVDGTGDWQYCYTLGSANDVMIPDWSTVEAAKAQIYAVLNGE